MLRYGLARRNNTSTHYGEKDPSSPQVFNGKSLCVHSPTTHRMSRIMPPPPSLPKVINKSNFVFNAKVRLLYNFPKIGIITSKQYLSLLRAHLLADSIDSDQCLMRLQYSIVIGKKMIGNEQK